MRTAPLALGVGVGLLLAALGTCVATGAVAPWVTSAARSHAKHNEIRLALPRVGHRRNARTTTRIPRRLPGYYAYVQVIGANGKASPRAGPRHPLVMKGPDGKKLFSITLRTRYETTSGRVDVSLTLKNIGVRHRPSVVRARVTLAWR